MLGFTQARCKTVHKTKDPHFSETEALSSTSLARDHFTHVYHHVLVSMTFLYENISSNQLQNRVSELPTNKLQ